MSQDLISEETMLLLEALCSIIEESSEAEIIRVALAALIQSPGGARQLQLRNLAL